MFLLGGEVLGEDAAVGESVGVGAVEEVVTVLLLVVTVTCGQTVKNTMINVDFLQKISTPKTCRSKSLHLEGLH